jgi:hypothetical protein
MIDPSARCFDDWMGGNQIRWDGIEPDGDGAGRRVFAMRIDDETIEEYSRLPWLSTWVMSKKVLAIVFDVELSLT